MSVVAIVGRPNVGKSTLFNKIVGSRKALVSDMPGLTRDRHYAEADWCGVSFTVIDTGGLSFEEDASVEAKVHRQSMEALREADVVICLFDGRVGMTPIDRDIVHIFRRAGKRVIYAVNKIDDEKNEGLVHEFNELGIDPIAISAEHSRNIDLLLDKTIECFPKVQRGETRRNGIRIALAGRPNVGKSTIINFLSKEERVVVHEVPGTTRDSIDVGIAFGGKDYVFVDTAGVKKRARTSGKVDKFATLKSLRAIEDADIVFIVADASEGVTRQDITLAAHSFNLYKPTAVLINKWDLMGGREEDTYVKEVRYSLKELHEIPVLCISGRTGHNCGKIFGLAERLMKAGSRRVPTAILNRFFEGLKKRHPVPDFRGKQVTLKYITQVEASPPVFVVFTNQPEGIGKSYKRFLMRGLRRLLGGESIPIVVKFRS